MAKSRAKQKTQMGSSLFGSRIARLIFASNLAGLIILIIGAMVLNEMRASFVVSKKQDLVGQAQLLSNLIADAATYGEPQPSMDEFLEILSIQSAAGTTLCNENRYFQRPFRSPHHTISDVGLLGGGSIPGPGEISLAHNGVLFLDELPEFKRSALEVLRQPLEDGVVTISRSAGKITLPCSVMMVCAMNPCPCGYTGDASREGRCSVPQIQRVCNESSSLIDN